MNDHTFLESLIGVPVPDEVLWIALGVIILFAVALVVWGFFKEIKKK